MTATGAIDVLAWLGAVTGAVGSSGLLTAEFFGRETPPRWPIRTHMWGRFVWLFLASVCWLIFRNM